MSVIIRFKLKLFQWDVCELSNLIFYKRNFDFIRKLTKRLNFTDFAL